MRHPVMQLQVHAFLCMALREVSPRVTSPLLYYDWWRHLSQRNPFHKPWPAGRQITVKMGANGKKLSTLCFFSPSLPNNPRYLNSKAEPQNRTQVLLGTHSHRCQSDPPWCLAQWPPASCPLHLTCSLRGSSGPCQERTAGVCDVDTKRCLQTREKSRKQNESDKTGESCFKCQENAESATVYRKWDLD